jgi:hypothetical protein
VAVSTPVAASLPGAVVPVALSPVAEAVPVASLYPLTTDTQAPTISGGDGTALLMGDATPVSVLPRASTPAVASTAPLVAQATPTAVMPGAYMGDMGGRAPALVGCHPFSLS